MKNLFKMIAIILGIGQSTPHVKYQENFEEGTFLNGKKVSFIPGVGYRENASTKFLTKKEFVAYMASKKIICL